MTMQSAIDHGAVEDLTQVICEVWTGLAERQVIESSDNFFDVGGNSFSAARAVHQLNSRIGTTLTFIDIYECPTPSSLARRVLFGRSHTPASKHAPADGKLASDQQVCRSLLPFQYWYYREVVPRGSDLVMAYLVDPGFRVIDGLVESAAAVVARHEALRMRYTFDEGVPKVQPGAGGHQIVYEFPAQSGDELRPEDIAQRLEALIAPSTGAVLKIGYTASSPSSFVLVVHHLVADAYSLDILVRDLCRAAESTAAAMAVATANTPGAAWLGQRIGQYVSSPESDAERAYWLNCPPTSQVSFRRPDPDDAADGYQVEAAAVGHSASVERAAGSVRMGIGEFFNACISAAYFQMTGERSVVLGWTSGGRELTFDGLNFADTVGWLVTNVPLPLVCESEDLHTMVTAVRDQIRAIPMRGLGNQVWFYAEGESQVGRRLAEIRGHTNIIVNFAGGLQRVDDDAPAVTPLDMAARCRVTAKRTVLKALITRSADDDYVIEWHYNPHVFADNDVRELASRCQQVVRELCERESQSDGPSRQW